MSADKLPWLEPTTHFALGPWTVFKVQVRAGAKEHLAVLVGLTKEQAANQKRLLTNRTKGCIRYETKHGLIV
jgi:hypothetical protein